MQQDDREGFMPGPLDELVPGLRQKAEQLPALPVHPRIVEARRDDASHAIVMASFAPAASLRAFHAALKPLVEAALLSELARPPAELRERYSPLGALELYAFAAQGFDVSPALETFAFASRPLDDPEARRALPLVRREARLVEGAPPDEPLARHVAPVVAAEHALCARLHDALLSHGPASPFGTEPGALARVLCSWLSAQGYSGVAPTRAGIERLEALVTQQTPGRIRWIEPLTFQALCDLVAVAAHTTWGRPVEWAVCEPDPETGLAPPALIRVQRDGEAFHVPLGEHVLRWCVMPVRAGESVPSLGAWAEHEFT